MTVTEPGIYREMPVEQYDTIPAVRRTFLWHLFKHSPGQAKYRQDNFAPNKPLLDGIMTHTALLQPELFPRNYAVMPPFENDPANLTADGEEPKSPKATKFYRDKKKQFEAMCEAGGTEVVLREDYDMAFTFGKNIRKDNVAGRFFRRILDRAQLDPAPVSETLLMTNVVCASLSALVCDGKEQPDSWRQIRVHTS